MFNSGNGSCSRYFTQKGFQYGDSRLLGSLQGLEKWIVDSRMTSREIHYLCPIRKREIRRTLIEQWVLDFRIYNKPQIFNVGNQKGSIGKLLLLLLKLTLEYHKTVNELLAYDAKKLQVSTIVLANRKHPKQQDFLCFIFTFRISFMGIYWWNLICIQNAIYTGKSGKWACTIEDVSWYWENN